MNTYLNSIFGDIPFPFSVLFIDFCIVSSYSLLCLNSRHYYLCYIHLYHIFYFANSDTLRTVRLLCVYVCVFIWCYAAVVLCVVRFVVVRVDTSIVSSQSCTQEIKMM